MPLTLRKLLPVGRQQQELSTTGFDEARSILAKLDPTTKQECLEGAKEAKELYETTFNNDNDGRRSSTTIVDNMLDFPRFRLDELTVGSILGQGGFGVVYEIRAINTTTTSCSSVLSTSNTSRSNSGSEMTTTVQNGCDNDQRERKNFEEEYTRSGYSTRLEELNAKESRNFIAKHCLRKCTRTVRRIRRSKQSVDARYAVKFLKPSIIRNPSAFPSACYDMALETRVLSSTLHPNIVKLRAIAQVPMFQEQYFFIMDRLYDTLDQRLIQWRRTTKRLNGLFGNLVLDRNGDRRVDIAEDRWVAAYDLSAGVAYLHSKWILYRDLKPENIGFDIRGDIKIFDFGLVAELRNEYRDDNGLYHLTPMTGSPRYMAPEVANREPYDESCDTYSFALVLWQILSLDIPFDGYDIQDFYRKVWQAPHDRPSLGDKQWGSTIYELLQDCWSPDHKVRRSMSDVESMLHFQCVNFRGGDESGLGDHHRRRSTHVFKPLEYGSSTSLRSSGRSLTYRTAFGISFRRNANNADPTMEG